MDKTTEFERWKMAELARVREWDRYWVVVDATTEEDFLAGFTPKPPQSYDTR